MEVHKHVIVDAPNTKLLASIHKARPVPDWNGFAPLHFRRGGGLDGQNLSHLLVAADLVKNGRNAVHKHAVYTSRVNMQTLFIDTLSL